MSLRPLESLFALITVLGSVSSAWAVTGTGSYATTTTSSIPGAAYVGYIIGKDGNPLSGTYLGNGYVLTAGHVGAGNFTLGTSTYDYVAGSAVNIGDADLTLFRISGDPGLTALTLPTLTNPPVVDSTSFYMIGYGGGNGESYAQDTVTETDVPTTVPGYPYASFDFEEETGTDGNTATLISGDSGGGDFTDVNGNLMLIGINEALLEDVENGPVVGSAFVQLNDYSALIEADMTPEPSTWLLFGSGLAAMVLWLRRRRRSNGQLNSARQRGA